MDIHYLFSSDRGELPLNREDLARPFLLSPQESHPFLTLGDYFQAIEGFLLDGDGGALTDALSHERGGCLRLEDVSELKIRSEKHGALYHISSVEVLAGERTYKYGVSAALSEIGRSCLKRETALLNRLGELQPAYIPRLHSHGEAVYRRNVRGQAAFSMMLTEWLEDCHEWHLSGGEEEQRLCIWDAIRGTRHGSKRERFETFKQAAKILAYYYDARSFEQIRLWHHAAGDFVVGASDEGLKVRLTTVRDYRPLEFLVDAKDISPAAAVVFFFAHLAVRIRLDKENGVGRTIWAQDFSVEAAVEGFFEALVALKEQERRPLGQVQDLLTLLRSFEEGELLALYDPLLEWYRGGDPEDFSMIQRHLPQHVRALRRALKSCRPQVLQPPS